MDLLPKTVIDERSLKTFFWGMISCIFLCILLSINCTKGDNDDTPQPTATPHPLSLADTAWPMLGQDQYHTCRSSAKGPEIATIKWSVNIGTYTGGGVAIDNQGNIVFGTTGKGLYCLKPDGTIKWIFDTIYPFESTPAIARDGTIYVGIENSQHLIALNSEGELKWSLGVGGGAVLTSPVIAADGTVYIGGSNGCLHAVAPDGTLKWRYCTPNVIRASPAMDRDGNIIIGSIDGYLYSIHQDGSLNWKFEAGGLIYSAAAVADYGAIYCTTRKVIYALSSEGELKWKYSMEGSSESSPGIGQDGTIYFINSYNLYAINPTGTLKWKADVGWNHGSPVIDNMGRIYLIGWTENGTLTAITNDGHILWSTYIGIVSRAVSPALGEDGTLYIGSTNHTFYAFHDAE